MGFPVVYPRAIVSVGVYAGLIAASIVDRWASVMSANEPENVFFVLSFSGLLHRASSCQLCGAGNGELYGNAGQLDGASSASMIREKDEMVLIA